LRGFGEIINVVMDEVPRPIGMEASVRVGG